MCIRDRPLSEYPDIKFFVKVIASKKFAVPKLRRPADLDPFDKNVCAKIYIESLSETHALLYNKFPLVPSHVLVVTKEMESQMSLINRHDFYAALKVMKALDCLVFFNGGAAAGASQKHKHLQAIPYNSFPNHSIPLNALIEATEQSSGFVGGLKFQTIEPFKFRHVLCKFERNFLSDLSCWNIEKQAKVLENVYMECLRRLNNNGLQLAYNFILTKRWLFVVLRKCEVALNMVKINAVGFTGSFAVRSDEEYKFIRNQDPFNVLQSVTFPT
eukprot:TRINITY_DN5781_c0_g1_i3.p1 TRINITY_DN5781_c0_g1~~TRINITY_DN5781_c0_g1_i3.p1  ORF type:complete len:272 (-),score=74.75 TRINITY_DN5781_c0_g1_i3:98-913(-)